MKMVLCSEGFSTPNTVQACVELCGKPQDKISVAIINEAYAVVEGDKYWVLDNLRDVAKNFTGGIDLVNLLALPLDQVEDSLRWCDVIFVVGGNTDYLMHVFNKTGFTKLLPKLLETKVYVGSSAGSMVIGRRISTAANEEIYGEPGEWGINDYLGLVDLAIKPHLNSENFPNNRPAVLARVAYGVNFPVYGLEDGSALVIDGNEQKFIGPKPVEIVGGEVVG